MSVEENASGVVRMSLHKVQEAELFRGRLSGIAMADKRWEGEDDEE